MQADILDEDAVINSQTLTHLTCAAIFFLLAIVTSFVVTIWQWCVRCCCSCCLDLPVRRIGLMSLLLKTMLNVLNLFGGVIGAFITYWTFPEQPFESEVFLENAQGAGQRVTITIIVLYLTTFLFEIKALQKESRLELPAETLVGLPQVYRPPLAPPLIGPAIEIES